MSHANNGKCEKCAEIFEKYPGFNKQLRSWFVIFQAKHPEAHISCAGRGFEDQEAARNAGASKAHYGQSAHNYNCAIDLFVMDFKNYPNELYPKKWFDTVLAPEIPFFLNWYGAPGQPFPEMPHLEIREWRKLIAIGSAGLVEPKKNEVA